MPRTHSTKLPLCSSPKSDDPQMVPKCPGTVNGVAAEIALDTGVSGIFVDKKFVRDEDYTGHVADGELGCDAAVSSTWITGITRERPRLWH